MSRLIDADELMEHAGRDRLDSREAIMQMISNAPTIEPTTGEWVEEYSDWGGIVGRCTACNKQTYSAINYDIKGNRHEMAYCPKCGARMVKE